jgi:hypothetical protein
MVKVEEPQPEFLEASVRGQGGDWARINLLLQTADHIEQQIGLGETRANLLLAASGALAAAFVAAIQATSLWSVLGSAGRWLFYFAVAALGISIIVGLWAVRPAWIVTRFGATRLRSSGGRGSIVHFASIAAQKPKDFITSFNALTEREIQDDLLRAIHGKSLKARAKFTELYCVTLCLIASVTLFGLSLLTLLLCSKQK